MPTICSSTYYRTLGDQNCVLRARAARLLVRGPRRRMYSIHYQSPASKLPRDAADSRAGAGAAATHSSSLRRQRVTRRSGQARPRHARSATARPRCRTRPHRFAYGARPGTQVRWVDVAHLHPTSPSSSLAAHCGASPGWTRTRWAGGRPQTRIFGSRGALPDRIGSGYGRALFWHRARARAYSSAPIDADAARPIADSPPARQIDRSGISRLIRGAHARAVARHQSTQAPIGLWSVDPISR